MEDKYRSLAVMKAAPWITHFKNSVGKSSSWTSGNRVIVIKGNKVGSGPEAKQNMPLNVVSPVEQYSQMAKAEMSADATVNKKTIQNPGSTFTARQPKKKQQGGPKKRKTTTGRKKQNTNASTSTNKRIKIAKDIFSQHDDQ